MRRIWQFFLIVLAAALSACAGPGAVAPPPPPAVGQYLAWPGPRVIDAKEFHALLAEADVVVVGESHTHPGHHAVQAQVLREMVRLHGSPLVGIEWLDSGVQDTCTLFSRGWMDVAELGRRVDWPARWGYPLRLYAPILEVIKDQGLDLVCLNAPVEIIRQVGRQGLASLTPAQRALLAPALDLKDPVYGQSIADQFAAHGMDDPQAQARFVAAQIARDETMAYNLTQRMLPWPDSRAKAVVFTGSGHMVHGLGLPPRIARRVPGAKVLTVLPLSLDRLPPAAELGPAPAPADVVVLTAPPPPPPPRLGIFIKAQGEGLVIERVLPGSAAADAGLQAGDILIQADDRPLRSAKDIHDTIKTAPYAPHSYQLLRQGRPLTVTITLPEPQR